MRRLHPAGYISMEAADEGTMLHARMEESIEAGGALLSGLRPDQQWALRTAMRYRAQVMQQALFDWDLGDFEQEIQEERLWCHVGLTPIYSGQFDYMAMAGKRGLLLDWKFGRFQVSSAEANWQTLGYAVLLWLHYGLEQVRVAIIQPRRSHDEQCTIGEYAGFELKQAHKQLLEHVKESQKGTGKRTPGEHACAFCEAKAICPEAITYFSTL
jgi:hypothetical protein